MADTAKPANVTPISADSKLSDQQKRDQLRARIEAGEKRNEQRTLVDQAKDAADTAVAFTKKHPYAVIGGAIAVGLAIGAMTKPGRRLGKRGGVFAGLVADAALAYGARMIDNASNAAHLAGDRFEDFGETAASTARDLRREAAGRLDAAGEVLRATSRKATRGGSRAAQAIKTRLTH
ncbi:hypothetical protein [Qipengyuania soli]|uniref:Uncharacterized protein n=1 Tax=Qipengyuania soli TaxID=2782568 RepID=A0A7S8F6C2_9SPHN|nr:hypothetical protein [Qipengyuania soli]QPC99925.1 hypothetical protein IRL76_05155 [Qipengyuania soli]